MKVLLMFKDRDFNITEKLPPNEPDLLKDLELNTLLRAMAQGDQNIFEVAKVAVLTGIKNDVETIIYRQNILKDCLENPTVAREIYDLAEEAITGQKEVKYFSFLRDYPDSILQRAIELIHLFVGVLKKLRKIAVEKSGLFKSEGFSSFFAMLKKELEDEFLDLILEHVQDLRFRDGILLSASLGDGNKVTNFILHRQKSKKLCWLRRIFPPKENGFTVIIADRDTSGFSAMHEMQNKGINLAANALAQSADNILHFFQILKIELGFFIGCLQLHDQLNRIGAGVSFPVPGAPEEFKHSFKGLYDVCLALTMNEKVVGNEMNSSAKKLVIITGANRGGKSIFLRSIGLAQLMMQSGIFTPAEFFSANLVSGVFTHYKREEDANMESGKLDEELNRMSIIVDQLKPGALLLLNESFAATNEREGSEIARQIVDALSQKRLKIFFVTHLYSFSYDLFSRCSYNAVFLRAERYTDGRRSFKIVPGEPLQTSYGKDLYEKIFKGNKIFL